MEEAKIDRINWLRRDSLWADHWPPKNRFRHSLSDSLDGVRLGFARRPLGLPAAPSLLAFARHLPLLPREGLVGKDVADWL